ncbi:alpha/beta hydrolase family protein [Aquincola tertiaricarbonis]|uniref:alpha/beta hydrolase family protein n=1 Tax=Aquincola tertiaricarbonis TaxID=391953 RepID=UPI000614DCC3|nr:chlorophyllase [Aquincola tertiaricarbonis]
MFTSISSVGPIPSGAPVPVLSVSPIVLPAPGRTVALQLRVSVPVVGRDLPIVLLSHGHGASNHLSSLSGYAPLANYWAARGFVVLQPTHLSSATLRGVVDPHGPEGALFWRSRAEDMTRVLDTLDTIEAAVPGLRGRVDRGRVAVAGHSLGGLTAGMLLGQRVTDADGTVVDLRDARIAAGVIIAGPGNPSYLTGAARDRYPILRTLDFSAMTAPALVVVGDRDVNPMFSDQAEYRAGAYTLSPGPKDLLTVFGGEHILGGISGYDAAETTDENPSRVEAVAQLAWAYLRTALNAADPAWSDACAALRDSPSPFARVDAK